MIYKIDRFVFVGGIPLDEQQIKKHRQMTETPVGPLILRLIAHRLHMAVYYVVGGSTACLADAIDLRPYSTESAGGFTGCTVGMYASANGAISDSKASFSWFAMRNL